MFHTIEVELPVNDIVDPVLVSALPDVADPRGLSRVITLIKSRIFPDCTGEAWEKVLQLLLSTYGP